jgi:cystathionine gamma-synthase
VKIAHLNTILSHAGIDTSASSNEPLSPSLHLESTYTRPPSGEYFNEQDGGKGMIYARMGNPTRTLLERTMTKLEVLGEDEAHRAITSAFSSGMAGIGAVIMAMPRPLHIILPDDIYHGVPTQLKTVFHQDCGITFSSIDMTDHLKLQKEIEMRMVTSKNILIWMETPSNPLCKVIDIQATCSLVQSFQNKDKMIATVVDSTWAPPTLTQPLMLGSDIVLHSGTKYLGGHSDVLLGVVTSSPFTQNGQRLGESIRKIQVSLGATASPFDCWLTLRGLRTLHLRVEHQSQTAMTVAKFLSTHPLVIKTHYPGLDNHPQHSIASRQMNNKQFGGMLSFQLKDEVMATAVAGAVDVIHRATSLGGTETLIEHRASIEPEDGKVSPGGLLRVSIGLEDADELIKDLDRAIRIAAAVVND